MTESVDITLVLGSFAGMLIGFYGIAKVMLSQASKDRDADRIERQQFSDAIEHMAKSSTKVAETNEQIATAVTKQASESEQRNGHLGELIVSQVEQTQAIANAATEKIIAGVQTVKEQKVEHQTIEKKEKK